MWICGAAQFRGVRRSSAASTLFHFDAVYLSIHLVPLKFGNTFVMIIIILFIAISFMFAENRPPETHIT